MSQTTEKKPYDSLLLGIIVIPIVLYFISATFLNTLSRLHFDEVSWTLRGTLWVVELTGCAFSITFAYRHGRQRLGRGLLFGTLICMLAVFSLYIPLLFFSHSMSSD